MNSTQPLEPGRSGGHFLKARQPAVDAVTTTVVDALEDLKGIDIQSIDIASKTSFADAMIIATGNSVRHVRALAESARRAVKALGIEPAIEGDQTSDWVLLDVGDVIVHVMTAERREFYALEKLWGVSAPRATEREVAAH